MRQETHNPDAAADSAGAVADSGAVAELAASLDPGDSQAVLFFGAKVQHRLSRISRKMLQTVAADDVAGAGQAVDEMLAALRQFELGDADPNVKLPWWRRLWPGARPLSRLLQAITELRHRVDRAGLRLEREKTALLTNVVAMERLDDSCRGHLDDLDLHILAAKKVLGAGGQAPGSADLLQRISDLTLSRQVGQQARASLLLVENSGRELIARVNFILTNTVPLWQQHMTQLVAMWRRKKAAHTLSEARDLTEGMARAGADLRAARERVREALGKGVYDLNAIETANRQLLSALEQGRELAEEGRTIRARAQAALESEPAS